MDDSACPQMVSKCEYISCTFAYVHVPRLICPAHLNHTCMLTSKKAFPTLITMETSEAFCYMFKQSH